MTWSSLELLTLRRLLGEFGLSDPFLCGDPGPNESTSLSVTCLTLGAVELCSFERSNRYCYDATASDGSVGVVGSDNVGMSPGDDPLEDDCVERSFGGFA
jgi:hypothetical protein